MTNGDVFPAWRRPSSSGRDAPPSEPAGNIDRDANAQIIIAFAIDASSFDPLQGVLHFPNFVAVDRQELLKIRRSLA